MATNFFFNNFQSSQEQLLIENLIIESIKIYGQDMYYLPRTQNNYDAIYGEDPISSYTKAHFVELYIKNVEGFDGEGDFLSKFNVEIRDRVTFTIARRVFNEEIGAEESLDRPREGDLIYFPLNKKIFKISFVEHEAIFYQLGSLQTYDLQCELFEYGGEVFDTGVEEIDILNASKYNITMQNFLLKAESNAALQSEDGFDIIREEYSLEDVYELSENKEVQDQSDAGSFVDFSEIDPFSEGRY